MSNTEVLRARENATPFLHSTVQAAVHTLRDAGIEVEHISIDHLRVAGRINFWVFTNFWASDDNSVRGYGITNLIATARSK